MLFNLPFLNIPNDKAEIRGGGDERIFHLYKYARENSQNPKSSQSSPRYLKPMVIVFIFDYHFHESQLYPNRKPKKNAQHSDIQFQSTNPLNQSQIPKRQPVVRSKFSETYTTSAPTNTIFAKSSVKITIIEKYLYV